MFRHIRKHIAIGLVTLIAACSGGGGGGGQTPLATGTFNKTAMSFGNDYSGHFSNVFPYFRVMHLYDASPVMESSGYIKAIAFMAGNTAASSTTCPDITIRMGHTSVTSLSATFASNIEQGKGTLETVLADAPVVIPPVNAGDYITIQLDKAFYYNGVDNLVVDFFRIGSCDNAVSVGADLHFPSHTVRIGTFSTEGLRDIGVPMKFTFAGGDKAVFTGAGDGSVSTPFTSEPSVQRQQQLYLAGEIDGSGPITGLAMQVDGTTTAQTYTATVKLGHSSGTALEGDYDANYSSTPTIVANAVTFHVPAGVPDGSYVWIPLTGSFDYNGTDNLILEIDVSTATGQTTWRYSDPGSSDIRLIYGPRDAFSITAISGVIHHVKFRFNGGTMDVVTPGTDNSNSPYGTYFSDHVLQVLYGAHDLGTKAHIDKVAFRLKDNSVASDYTGFSVVLGHTTNTLLSRTLADNLDDRTTVFSGTMSIPAGLKAGDWVEIPVSGFTYDPGKNLTIQITTDAGTNANAITAGPLAIAGASVSRIGSPTVDLGIAFDISPDLRLSYTKY